MASAPRALKLTGASLAIVLATSAGLETKFEGEKFKPYQDGAQIWTVCDGHTGAGVVPGKTYTKAECDALRAADNLAHAQAVISCITRPVPEVSLGAIADLHFNARARNFCDTGIVRKLNAGDLAGACDEIPRWHYIHRGRQLVDCTKKNPWCGGIPPRREAERATCRLGLEEANKP